MTDFALGLTVDHSDVSRGLSDIERKQLPMATVWGLNDTAADMLDHVQNRMEVVFDRPTRFTKNAFMVWRANKKTMEARVQERPSVGSKHFLKVQEDGGARPQTGVERMLGATLPYEGLVSALVPAAGAKLNAYGNWSPAQRKQALSAASGAAQAARSRARYFVPDKRSNLSSGIWKRTGKGKREKLTKVAHFLDAAPSYTKRLGFFDGAQEVFNEKFPDRFFAAFDRAMASRK